MVSVEDQFLSEHNDVDAADGTAHEGTPGHALLAGWWASLYGGHKTPIAWAHQHDVTNFISGSWQTMTFIEGWALLAEELLKSTYTVVEALDAQKWRLIRAIRVRIGLGLHAGFLNRNEAAAELAISLGETLDRAIRQIRHRYGRQTDHGQAYTYYLGMREIKRLCTNWLDQNPGSTANDFYFALFHQPPLPPTVLRRWMLKGETP